MLLYPGKLYRVNPNTFRPWYISSLYGAKRIYYSHGLDEKDQIKILFFLRKEEIRPTIFRYIFLYNTEEVGLYSNFRQFRKDWGIIQ